jgi:excinuclease ABC subunit A
MGRFLRIFGARAHNLKNIDLMIPLRMLVAVTGVSGSGKSTVVHDVLYKALEARRAGGTFKGLCGKIEGDNLLQGSVLVDQSPIGRTPRSNPATYLKAFDSITRTFFVQYPGWPLRSLPGRRHGDSRDAVPGGRGIDLRRMPRDAFQERRA